MPEEYDYVITKPPLDEYLEHHGVKGQKWGIRKQKPTLGLARRRINTGVASLKSRTSKFTKNSKKRKGYSAKDYSKYRKKGMSHNQAIAAAKKARKKKVAGVLIGAAALTAGVLLARKHNINVQNAKRLANQTGDTKALEKQLKEKAKKAQNAWKDYKFDGVDHYEQAKKGATLQKYTEAVKKAKGKQENVDMSKIVPTGNEVKKYAYTMSQKAKEAADRAEARKLKNRVKAGAKRWWNGQ